MQAQGSVLSIIVGALFKALICTFTFYLATVTIVVLVVIVCSVAGYQNSADNAALTIFKINFFIPFVIAGSIYHTLWKLTGKGENNATR